MAAVPSNKRVRLGELMIARELINEEQLERALQEQKRTGRKLGQTLIGLDLAAESDVLTALAEQLEIPYIELKHFRFDRILVQTLPEVLARRFRVLVLREDSDGYLLGMVDPTDIFCIDELARLLKKPIKPAVVTESELLDIIGIAYSGEQDIASLAGELHDELTASGAVIDLETIGADVTAGDAPVVKLLQRIFEFAVNSKASDIHIEPDEKVLRIRQRVDGVLTEQVMNEKRIANALMVRLKLMSDLDISEKRLPQDGRFNLKIKDRNIDIRLSTMPVQFGESVVMRLLDHTEGVLPLDKVGMPDNLVKRFRQLINRPHGLILVTGPTGSGKTTTLYGALSEINLPEAKIITVEDPVEYRLPRVNQVQVHERIGLDFNTVLRATLRQDPDILLVGEIRDRESAEIALRAAMTGHLVLSTLHTNDALTSALRLVDIGVDGYLIATALKAVVAQRLVRRVCETCSEPHEPDANEQQLIASIGLDMGKATYRMGAGCPHCNETGYRGRIGVFEMLEINRKMAEALRVNDVNDFSRGAVENRWYKPLSQRALEYAGQGITSLYEVMRVTAQVEDESQIEELQPNASV
jgi:MSHA biogenesis protein MshE